MVDGLAWWLHLELVFKLRSLVAEAYRQVEGALFSNPAKHSGINLGNRQPGPPAAKRARWDGDNLSGQAGQNGQGGLEGLDKRVAHTGSAEDGTDGTSAASGTIFLDGDLEAATCAAGRDGALLACLTGLSHAYVPSERAVGCRGERTTLHISWCTTHTPHPLNKPPHTRSSIHNSNVDVTTHAHYHTLTRRRAHANNQSHIHTLDVTPRIVLFHVLISPQSCAHFSPGGARSYEALGRQRLEATEARGLYLPRLLLAAQRYRLTPLETDILAMLVRDPSLSAHTSKPFNTQSAKFSP